MPTTIEYYRRRRKIAVIALGSSCVRCGAESALEFDHIDPATKRLEIGKEWSHPDWWDEVLTRCQLLCHDCHLEKTRQEQRRDRGFTHGTWYAWMTKKCRCEECEPLRGAYNELRRSQRRIAGDAARGPYRTGPPEHGTEAMYRKGCRRQCCKDAHALKLRQHREGRQQRARDGNRHTSAS